MDKWKDIEVEKMKVGGNNSAREFFMSHRDCQTGISLQEKYNSKTAALYRDKIITEADGREWSEDTSLARNYSAPDLKNHGGNASNSPQQSGNRKSISSSSSDINHSNNINSMDDLENFLGKSKGELSAEKEEYFKRKQLENESKRDDLPPSQGGKYVGFGSSVTSYENSDSSDTGWDSTLNSLQTGWNMFSVGATKIASQAGTHASKLASQAGEKAVKLGTKMNENVIKPASSKKWLSKPGASRWKFEWTLN